MWPRRPVRYCGRPLKPELLELLVCPVDAAALTSDDGELICAKGHRFPVRDGVPRLVPPSRARSATRRRPSTRSLRSGRAWTTRRSVSASRPSTGGTSQRFGFETRTVCGAFSPAGSRCSRPAPASAATPRASPGCPTRPSSGSTSARASSPPIAVRRATPNLHYIQADLLRPPLRRGTSTSSRPTRSSTTRRTPPRPCARSPALVKPRRHARLLRLQAQGADARVRRRLHARAHDEDERRGVHGVQRVDERAGAQAVGRRRDDHARARHPAAGHRGRRARRPAARSTGTS